MIHRGIPSVFVTTDLTACLQLLKAVSQRTLKQTI